MNEFKRILVVVRMIQTCRKAIQFGVSLARESNAELYVIHTVHETVGLKGWGLGTRELAREYEKHLVDSKRKLASIINEEKTHGMSIKEIVQDGEPTEEILKTIKEENIDLVVMLTHEEGRIEHFLFGRSNEELIRKMPCSLLLVKKEPGAIVDEEDDA